MVVVLGAIVWMVWYDMNKGYTASPVDEGGSQSVRDLSSRDVQADIRRTRETVQPDGFLGSYFTRFHRRAGRHPARLKELFERPPDLPPSRWDGPYLSTPDLLNDAWGRPYHYLCPGKYNKDSYDLWSVGPDGVNGTADDIGNW